jgi:hypothetical protein
MVPASVQVLVNTRTRKRTTKKRPRARGLRRDGGRAVIACLLLGSLLWLGNEVNFGKSLISTRPEVAARPAGENLTSASILFVPRSGNDCRLRQIDNATWRIWEQGVVDCQSVLNNDPRGDAAQGWSTARVDVIREGFLRNR